MNGKSSNNEHFAGLVTEQSFKRERLDIGVRRNRRLILFSPGPFSLHLCLLFSLSSISSGGNYIITTITMQRQQPNGLTPNEKQTFIYVLAALARNIAFCIRPTPNEKQIYAQENKRITALV